MEKIRIEKDQNGVITITPIKRVLKRPIKIILIIMISTILMLSMIIAFNKVKNDFKECDIEKGYTCTIYDLTHNRK